jgi:phage head maturation protease
MPRLGNLLPMKFATKNRLPRRKYASELAGGVLGYEGGLVQATNANKASAKFRISTIDQDRDGDVVRPKGCLKFLEAYRKNPIVLFDHDAEGMPVGLSETDNSLSLWVMDDWIDATCYFHQKTQKSAEVCDLTLSGILRAASIGFRPLKNEKIYKSGNHVGHDFLEWELTEWSICSMGANADALRLRLDGNRIKSVSLRRQLEAVAAKVNRSQVSLSGVKMAANVAKAIDDEEEDTVDAPEEDKDADPADEVPEAVTDDAPEEETPEEAPEEAAPEEAVASEDVAKPGMLTLADLHRHAQMCLDYCNEAMKHNEQAGVVSHLTKIQQDMQDAMEEIKAVFSTEYPDGDLDSLMGSGNDPETPADTEEPGDSAELEPTDDLEPTTKRYKRLKKSHQACITETKEFLDDMGDDARVPKSYKGGCKYYSKSLSDLLEGDNPKEEDEPELETKEEEVTDNPATPAMDTDEDSPLVDEEEMVKRALEMTRKTRRGLTSK